MMRWLALAISAALVAPGTARGAPAPGREAGSEREAAETTAVVETSAAAEAGGSSVALADPSGDGAPSVDAPIELLPRKVSTARRIAAIGAAIVPGFVLRGAGSWVLGERRAARRLATVGAIGVGGMLAGGLAVGLTGASPSLSTPGVPILLLGAGLYLPTWFADIWVASGGGSIRGTPRAPSPWSIEVGSTWLHDPYRSRALARVAARVELGRLGLAAHGMLDAGGDAQTGGFEARWRLYGTAPTFALVEDGSRLVIRAAGHVHRDEADRVTLSTGELELILRGDLRRLSPELGGMFVEVSSGVGLQRASYPLDRSDLDAILLGRFAWGAYLGGRGEATLFYDHRRDHLAGGLAAWRAAGFFGSFGASADVLVAGPWAIRGELEIGNAWVSTLAVRYHGGLR
ncbi:MAG: hypothetical protein ACTHU0_13665 [Kofleriaceae bacterium]